MNAGTWDATNRVYEMWPVLIASRKREILRYRKRKFRLVACALCRSLWDILEDPRSRHAVEAAERFADGQIDDDSLASARRLAWEANCRGDGPRREAAARTGRREIDFGLADAAAGWVAHKNALEAAQKAASNSYWVRQEAADKESVWETCDLLREVFGNPFRPAHLDPAWRTPAVVSLATAAYEMRKLPSGKLDPVRLAILADALEETGCTDEQVFAHLRGPGPHPRGCWVVDSVLGQALGG